MKFKFLLVFLFTGTLAWCQNTDNSLVVHYMLDHSAVDNTIHHNDGIIVGEVNPTKNRFGIDCSACDFDGKTGYIFVNHNEALASINDKLTVAVWAKLSPQSKNFWFTICCKSDQEYEDRDSPHFRFQLTKKTVSINTDFTAEWDQNFLLDQWYFLCFTVNKNVVRFFVNGVLVLDTTYNKHLETNNYGLTIGRDIPGNDEFFHGSLDDLRIYNRALSSTEIKTLFLDQSDASLSDPCNSTGIHSSTTATTNEMYDDLPQTIEGIPIQYQKTITVKNRAITIIPYDDGKQDNDSVSININGIWVKENYKIKNKANINAASDPPLKINLVQPTNFLISKALNVGTVPPNTLAIDIIDGVNPVQTIVIHSDIGYSGGIKIVYDGP